MDSNFIKILENLEKEKGIDKSYLLRAIEAALVSASKRQHDNFIDPSFIIDDATGRMSAFVMKTVVESPANPDTEISIEDAAAIDPEARIGGMCRVEVSERTLLGRIGAQRAKQVFVQKIHEAEQEILFNEFQDKVGTVISGPVTRIERGNVFVDMGKGEAAIPVHEKIPGEDLRTGQTVKGYIIEVKKTSSPAQIIISRTHPGFVKSLFRLEVPEIEEGVVEIKAVAREPGERCKIAIATHSTDIDPVGTCVGIRGTRIRNIVRELREEKVDIIPWSSDIGKFIISALNPAKVNDVIIHEQDKSVEVIVGEDQLSLAIGRKGQNVRLAAKLTGWKVNVKTLTQLKTEECVKNIQEKLGISTNMAWDIVNAGFNSFEGIADADVESLVKIPGVGEKTAEKLIQLAKEQ